MGERIRGFMPWGEWRPDLRYLANDGLRVAEGVVPVYGSYISSPAPTRLTAEVSIAGASSRGLHVDQSSGLGYVGLWSVTGAVGDIFEVTDAGGVTNVSKAVGAYIEADLVTGWQGCNFGQNVIMCAGSGASAAEIVQYRAPGAALFADLITSTFAPRGRFCFSLRNNLFLANCVLPGAYDGLGAGANPVLVAWSRSDVPREFGSFNADPQLIGAGYQELNFDIGNITGAAGGVDFGIIATSNGIVRVDGPPYTFRVLTRNFGTLFPNSVCLAGNDLWYYGPGGLTVIRGSDGAPSIVGSGRFTRSLIDATTEFWNHASNPSGLPILDASIAHDPVSNLLFISYTPLNNSGIPASGILVYNIDEDRASFFYSPTSELSFLRAGRQTTNPWQPGRDIRYMEQFGSGASGNKYYGKFVLGSNSIGSTLQRGYIQFSTKATQRLLRVRPIYHVSDQAAIEQFSVTIDSTNKPYLASAASGPYSSLDSMGWITTPDTVFADFHAPKFVLASGASMHKVVEFEGFEYEVELGAVYAA